MIAIMSEYTWRVWKYNRFAGYVTAPGEWQAISAAEEKFGKGFILVERVWIKYPISSS
jgi:hypothetical protein